MQIDFWLPCYVVELTLGEDWAREMRRRANDNLLLLFTSPKASMRPYVTYTVRTFTEKTCTLHYSYTVLMYHRYTSFRGPFAPSEIHTTLTQEHLPSKAVYLLFSDTRRLVVLLPSFLLLLPTSGWVVFYSLNSLNRSLYSRMNNSSANRYT